MEEAFKNLEVVRMEILEFGDHLSFIKEILEGQTYMEEQGA